MPREQGIKDQEMKGFKKKKGKICLSQQMREIEEKAKKEANIPRALRPHRAIMRGKLTRCTKDKLAILEIPPEFSEPKPAYIDLSKAQLNAEDKAMVDLVLEFEVSGPTEEKEPPD
ncbi:unnamed protein product [Ceutorhynchus assimilis]|uniref:Uncharacterized protein n=1 Tax=Ceutorhynchus assimilis TaxID=467358 RepID=A0A9N9MDS1_9CUCU|nr:unnamed protein product [Ceutorhynchus assimilis]